MQIRMMPISFAFNRFPRMVRDLAIQLNKKIELEISGENTELDKTVMERIGDPLVHLVRNSMDHGIEKPEERLEKGKPEHGTVKLDAFHQGGNIIIEIRDMNKSIIFIVCLLTLFSANVYAQPCTGKTIADIDVSRQRILRAYYDNDYFTGKNQYYTQGVRLELIHPSFKNLFF